MQNLIILGSTGSLGRQVLDVVRKNGDEFRVIGLSCGKNVLLLKKQVEEFGVEVVCVGKNVKFQSPNDNSISNDKIQISNLRKYGCRILSGEEGLTELAAYNGNKVVLVNCLSGHVGLLPTLAAIQSSKNIIMANKESVVMAGEILFSQARKKKVEIIPLDSEHTSIFKILQGVKKKDIKKVVLTCSGGPFLEKKKRELAEVSKKEVLKHPTWKMGEKITVDCATLVNKGLEIIEAQKFFNLKPEQIEVVIHPESLVHCLVYLKNGEVLASSHKNDMRIPIGYCLGYMDRLKKERVGEALCLAGGINPPLPFHGDRCSIFKKFTFKKPDLQTFEGLKLGFEVAKKGGIYPALYSLADEIAVAKFLKGEIEFLEIVEFIKKILRSYKGINKKPTITEIMKIKEEL